MLNIDHYEDYADEDGADIFQRYADKARHKCWAVVSANLTVECPSVEYPSGEDGNHHSADWQENVGGAVVEPSEEVGRAYEREFYFGEYAE